MNPNLTQRLMELPEGRDLRDFLLSEANKLNQLESITGMLDSITGTTAEEIALQTLSRVHAYKAIMKMLSTLFDGTQFDIIQAKDDSISVEMLPAERSQDSNQE